MADPGIRPQIFRLDRRWVQRSFDRASASYDSAALLQANVRAELLSRLEFFRLSPGVVLDLGCGTGEATTELRRRFPRALHISLDLAPGMLAAARRRQRFWRRTPLLCADAMQLPLADGCVDLVYSNLMLQWCDRPAAAFAEIKRVLRPGGLLMASTFGPATLQELRAAWSNADSVPHVSEFVDLPQLASAAMAGGLAEPVLDVETVLRHYRDVGELQQELRAIGARNARNDRRHSLMGKSRLKQMIAAYENVRESRGLPATYEVFFLSAFGAEGSRRESLSRTTAGEHVVPIHNLPTRKRP